MGNKLKKFKEVCPRQLSDLPCESCPIALERINAIKADGSDKKKRDSEPQVGCPWFVASSEHHFCFWVYNQFLDGDPASDREICDQLLISKPVLEKTFESAIEKLQEIKESPEMRDLVESVADMAEQSNVDFTSYMPSEFREAMDRTSVPAVEDSDKPKEQKSKIKTRIKHPTGLPLHRDGRKVDLFGLYSRKAPPKRVDTKGETKDDAKSEKKDNKK